MVVVILAPHTILPPDAALSTYPSYYFAASSLASHSSRSYFSSPPTHSEIAVSGSLDPSAPTSPTMRHHHHMREATAPHEAAAPHEATAPHEVAPPHEAAPPP